MIRYSLRDSPFGCSESVSTRLQGALGRLTRNSPSDVIGQILGRALSKKSQRGVSFEVCGMGQRSDRPRLLLPSAARTLVAGGATLSARGSTFRSGGLCEAKGSVDRCTSIFVIQKDAKPGRYVGFCDDIRWRTRCNDAFRLCTQDKFQECPHVAAVRPVGCLP